MNFAGKKLLNQTPLHKVRFFCSVYTPSGVFLLSLHIQYIQINRLNQQYGGQRYETT